MVDSGIHFSDEDWRRIERDWSAWWEGELKRPLVMIADFVAAEKPGPGLPLFTARLPFEITADEVAERVENVMARVRFRGDAFPYWMPNFGAGAVAAFLGANVNVTPRTVWFEPSAIVGPADLHPRFNPDNVWWKRVRDITVATVNRLKGRIAVSHTDLGGNLDILASLRGSDNLLLDLIDAPAEVDRLAAEITSLWLRYYDELHAIIVEGGRGTASWAPIWSLGRCYMFQCDLSYMFSPKMFERFVLPDLNACCNVIEHGFYHLDGKGEIPHLDHLLSLERLKGIQWIPGDGAPPPEEWLPLLKRIKDGGKLCQLYVRPEGAMTIVKELGGRGFALQIEALMNEEKAQDFLKALAAVDPDSTWEPRPVQMVG